VFLSRRIEFENKCNVVLKLVYIEAFAILNIYYLDLSRKKANFKACIDVSEPKILKI